MSRGLKHLLVRLGIVAFGVLCLLHLLWFYIPVLSIILGIIGFTIMLMSAVILVGEPLPPFGHHKCKLCDEKADVTGYISCEYGPIVQGHYCIKCANELKNSYFRYQFN